jgi:hypothetical protein
MSDHPRLGPDSLMKQKVHGTCTGCAQSTLRWGCDVRLADQIACFNRHYAEHSGYWKSSAFLSTEKGDRPIHFYDSVTGKPLYRFDPEGKRSFADFVRESTVHGWPSFRDEDVVWDNCRVLSSGEMVSIDGTHLGHNLPDNLGHRYCINLVCCAGKPSATLAKL